MDRDQLIESLLANMFRSGANAEDLVSEQRKDLRILSDQVLRDLNDHYMVGEFQAPDYLIDVVMRADERINEASVRGKV